jgi:hypothetical protein
MRHIVAATGLTTGEHLAMCGHVFPSYRAAVDAGHQVGNYTPTMTTLAAYHARGVDCEPCAIRHSQSGGHIGIAV